MSGERITALFDKDPRRVEQYRISAAGLTLDYSKNLINNDSLNLFSRLIDANALPQRVQQMFDGERVNTSENRRALHTLLRARLNKAVAPSLAAESEAIRRVLARMETIAGDIRSGAWTGHNGKAIRQIINIGIGGPHLGPEMCP